MHLQGESKMWFYVPKNRSQVYRTRKAFYQDNIFKRNRRFRYAALPKIREALWYNVFMQIGLRIGFIAFFMLFNFGAYYASLFTSIHTVKPQLPSASSFTKQPSSRFQVLISIDRTGQILVEGESYTDPDETGQILVEGASYNDADLSKVLNFHLLAEPRVIATLIVDRECEMQYVQKVYRVLRKSGIQRITHIVIPSKSILQKWKKEHRKLPFT